MCRIFGHLGVQRSGPFGGQRLSPERAQALLKIQSHGGPDGEGYETGDFWSLGNNRLAIQGLDGGRQPFCHEQSVYVVYNGEIYNSPALRKMLEQDGFTFSDSCDGSILPALYLKYGAEMFSYLDGMFAIAVLDLRECPTLLLASDPTATKSIYYQATNDSICFASELNALRLLDNTPREIRPEAIDLFLTMRAVCSEETIFRNIFSLAPAQIITFDLEHGVRKSNYQSRVVYESNSGASTAQEFLRLLTTEIEQLLQAETPICTTLSGGLDSSLITAIAAKFAPLQAFHIAYKGEWPLDERSFAESVALELGVKLQIISADIAEFPDIIPAMVSHLGQPNAAPHALSTYLLFREIHRAGYKVALTGEGADEFFAGYERFQVAFGGQDGWIPRYLDLFGPFTQTTREKLYSPAFSETLSGNTTYNRLTQRLAETSPGERRLRVLLDLDQRERFSYYILRRVDHLSMAHAVEARVPFCQPRVVSCAAQLPSNQLIDGNIGKKILFSAARDILPQSILTRKKQPFTLPVIGMLQPGTVVHGYASEVLGSRASRERGFFDPRAVTELLDGSRALSHSETHALWSLLVLELWMQSNA